MALTEMQQKWVDALRSGKYKQARGRLRRGKDSLCCLGVACVIAGVIPPVKAELLYENEDTERAQELMGLVECDGGFLIGSRKTSLSALNDKGKTFAEIADIIESEPEGLFVKEGAA